MDTSQPHDGLFKHIFSDPESAFALLRAVLDEQLVAAIDPRSLVHEPASFIDDELRQVHRDLVFSAKLRGEDVLIYVLLEHQSSVDPLMPFRMLRYIVRLWEGWLREHSSKRLPAVLPIVLHQGEAVWKGPRRLEDLLSLPPELVPLFRPVLPSFELTIQDLAVEDAERLAALPGPAAMKLTLLAFKLAAAGEDPFEAFERFGALFHELLKRSNRAFVLLRYTFERGGLDEEAFLERVRHAGGKDADVVIDKWDQLVEQHRQEGREEGRRELLERQLTVRFGELDDVTRSRLVKATTKQLERWAERVLTAKTLAAVFARKRA